MSLILIASNSSAPRSCPRDRVLRKLTFANAELTRVIEATRDPTRRAVYLSLGDTIAAAARMLEAHPGELSDD